MKICYDLYIYTHTILIVIIIPFFVVAGVANEPWLETPYARNTHNLLQCFFSCMVPDKSINKIK